MGAVGGESCSIKNGGPADVNIQLVSPTGDILSSVSTTSAGTYTFMNVIPGIHVACTIFSALGKI